jgi:hypothetical protein
MHAVTPAEQQQRRDDYVARFGFNASAPNPILGPSIREPSLEILDSDLDAVLKVAETIATRPEYVLALWIVEGKETHNALLHPPHAEESIPLNADPAKLDQRALRAFARSVLLFAAFGSDAFTDHIPRGSPTGDNVPRGVEGDHDGVFLRQLARMRAIDVGGMVGRTDREILDYFTVSGGGMRVKFQAQSIDVGLRDDSLASWLWLQAGLFEVYRRDTEQQLFEMYSEEGAVSLSTRPWVTYLRWNGGPGAVTTYLGGFHHREQAISRRFGDTPDKLPAEQLAKYYGTPQSRAALVNAVTVKYLVESVRGWFE